MTRLSDKQKRGIRHLIDIGWTRKEISKITGIPEGTISHYQNPKKQTRKTVVQKKVVLRDNMFLFWSKELAAHDNEVAERAYRKAAVCTVNKLMCLSEMPIQKAIKQICQYQIYLINEYDLKSDGKKRVK